MDSYSRDLESQVFALSSPFQKAHFHAVLLPIQSVSFLSFFSIFFTLLSKVKEMENMLFTWKGTGLGHLTQQLEGWTLHECHSKEMFGVRQTSLAPKVL